ncbi:hypothetical protein OV090_07380 [Nannocystis sp. RBIL2]|uniref:hypothetical protein n=1 Tax=Nannocystis sp. RBIL2 TaxID=2996788 RepID=UPI002270AA3D|nr:hypothetical protein [Nannocystis sp. RBIL2]MCY1064577.1 hypothetical protein [Nannocystis sp. RBIL2]
MIGKNGAIHSCALLLGALLSLGCGDSAASDTDSETGGTSDPEPPVELDASGCLDKCVKDIDPSTIRLVEIDCDVCDYDPTDESCGALVACVEIWGEWTIPDGEAACFHFRFDDNAWTPGPLDDMSQTCIDRGSNGEFGVLRRDEAPAGTVVAVSCVWAPDPATACP